MRKALAAALIAIPTLASAQAIHSVARVLASVEAPAFAFQAGAISSGAPRVFTGLIAPIRMTQLQLGPTVKSFGNGEVVVSFVVNTAGVPENVQIVHSFDEAANAEVVEAVRKIRYTPGKLDGQTVAVPVTLHVALTGK